MIRVDMHVHSKHSKHPSEWFLQKLGARESYTEVERIYQLAKKRGMDFVTISDHNTIDGAMELHAAHPNDTFISCEFTTYFPENGCKVHVLCFGITPAQFEDIQSVRGNVYEMRDYLREHRIACSVAHATYSVNGRLDTATIEKLTLLFDVFENVNGARNASNNEPWCQALERLMPNHISELYEKHGIEPWGSDSWIKGFTAGSDDHAGLFIGETWTMAPGGTVQDFLERLRNRETFGGGKHGNHKSMAFALYKIACDYCSDREKPSRGSFWQTINSLMLGDEEPSLFDWVNMQKVKLVKKHPKYKLVAAFVDDLNTSRMQNASQKERIDKVYNCLAMVSDEFFKMLAVSLKGNLRNGKAGQLFKNLTASLPMAFLVAPFFTAMKHQHSSKNLSMASKKMFGGSVEKTQKKVLWFTDTITELNGVAVTMRHLAECSATHDRTLKIAMTLDSHEDGSELGGNLLKLPCVFSFTPDFYDAFAVRIPSLLRSLDLIEKEHPDEIVISTPGPVGMVGYIAAKALRIKCTGIYHTDFTRQVSTFIDDEMIATLVEWYTRWFFGAMDEVRVPSEKYIDIMEQRGLSRSKMKLFRRGINPEFVCRDEEKINAIRSQNGLEDKFVVLWAGRIGQEKNVEFLLKAFEEFRADRPDSVLVLAGNGPMFEELKSRYAEDDAVILPGRLERNDLAGYYAMSDVFAFPSVTDTFGMVVLEAQASGVPAIVSDFGGPQDIVTDQKTGYVLGVEETSEWVKTLTKIYDLKQNTPDEYSALRQRISEAFECKLGWLMTIDDMLAAGPDLDGESDSKGSRISQIVGKEGSMASGN